MFQALPEPSHIPCVDCGESVERDAMGIHICDADRVHYFRLFPFRAEIAAFEAQLEDWLASSGGRFAVWIAERERAA